MAELALVLMGVAAMGLVALAAATLTPELMAGIGLGTLLLGLALGLPTGLWYHVILFRFVSAKIPLPRGWWLAPSNLHGHLTAVEQRRIQPWYRIGGVGFVLCVVGGATAIAGLLLGR